MNLRHWLRRLSRSWLVAGRWRRPQRTAQVPRPCRPRTRLRLEGLEQRVLPSTFEVVPAGQAKNTTTFATLSAALGVAHNGDIIQIEPGSTPGSATVTQNNLTIQGDPAAGAAGLQSTGTQLGTLTLQGNNDAVTNLFLADVFINPGSTGETVSNSILKSGNVQQTIGSGFTDGGNTVTGNTFLGGSVFLGDPTSGSSAANDTITNNTFTNPAITNAIVVQNETSGLVISGNRISSSNAAQSIIGIEANDSFGVISGNAIQLAANNGNFGILVQDENAQGNPGNVNIAVENNSIDTSGAGIGIAATRLSGATSFNVSIAGNVLTGNNIGIKLFGNSSGSAADYGNVSIGGSNGGVYSAGGNNLAGYSGSNGNFAILTTDGGKAAANTAVPAEHNLFGAANPQTVVSADTNTTIDANNALIGVRTMAGNVSATFNNGSAQTLTLSASVSDPLNTADLVNAGTVTFTVKDKNGAIIGNSVSAPVINGSATAKSYSLPAGQAPASYTIEVSYSDPGLKYGDLGDTGGTLTVNPADVTTKANSSTAVFSTTTQTINLSAAVADTSNPADTVSEGVVTFTIKDGQGKTIGTAQGDVSGGSANSSFTLPAGQAAGSYTIAVSYADNNGKFSDGGDTSSTLTVSPAGVTTTANSTSAVFSSQTQTVLLRATVANGANEGSITFTLLDSSGHVIGSPVSGSVSGGTATANYTLPAGQAAGSYTLAVRYNDSNGNFVDNGDINSVLRVSSASSSVQLTSVAIVPNLFSFTATETVTAHASSPGNTIPGGMVTFTLGGSTLSAPVDANGNASVQFTLPLLNLFTQHGISARYDDASGDLASTSASDTLQWLPLEAFFPSTTQLAADGSQTIDVLGSLLSITYDPQGRLTALSILGIPIHFA